jgi:ketosteroid isomerase-like protein
VSTIDPDWARQFAEDWIAAWNAHDVDRVLSHYDENVTFRSPFIATVAGEPSGRLTGVASLRAYWSRALTLLPQLHFTLVDILVGVESITLYYSGHRGKVAETFHFNHRRLVDSATACYSIDK